MSRLDGGKGVSVANISSAGFGSGLDINSLVDQLVAAEGGPVLNRLTRQDAQANAELSAFGLLKSSLSTFQTSLTALKSLSSFTARTVSSSDEDVVTATVADDAPTSVFEVEIEQLAEAHKLISTGFTSAQDTVGTGTLNIDVGGTGFSVTLSAAASSLTDLRDAINSAQGNAVVSATIANVDDGSGGTESKLLLTAQDAGLAQNITVTADDDDGTDLDTAGLSRFVFDPNGSGTSNLTESQASLDAKIKIDGQAVTRSSNSITDAVEGITLNLVKADVSNKVEIRVTENDVVASNAVRTFVTDFNALLDAVAQLTSFDPTTRVTGTLFSDASVRGLESQLRRELGARIAGIGASFSTLAEIGVTTAEGGKLTVDGTRLDAAVDESTGALQELFNSTGGMVDRLQSVVSGYLGADGLIEARNDGINARLTGIASQREALDRRLQSLQSRLLGQFIAMDKIVASLQSTSDFLTNQLSSLQSIFSNSNN